MNGKGSRQRPCDKSRFDQNYQQIFRNAPRPASEVIPPMTHPLGLHWEQPDPSTFLMDNTYAYMSRAQFDKLPDYSHSQPTGVYEGKMWRAEYREGGWALHWWDTCPDDPAKCRRNNRHIRIVA